jgi:thiamine-monophosphate kinase
MSSLETVGEFETIDQLFRPLAHPEWAAGLQDDVATLPSRLGQDILITKDVIVEGVHFLPDDPLDTVAQKALRTNLSDLAAKGAEPFGYLLACQWSARCGLPERAAFAEGLAKDQVAFRVSLLGGDTVVTPGPFSVAITAMGWVPSGRRVLRSGAVVGDAVFVTGTIGDAWLGLRALNGRLALQPDRQAAVIDAYRRPQPRLDFASTVLEHAHASIDVSDGLVADLGHIARASRVGIEFQLETLPLSAAGAHWFEGRVDAQAALVGLATAGDDYEIAFCAPARLEETLRRAAEARHLRLTRIGQVVAGQGVSVTYGGKPTEIDVAGYVHR